MAKKKNQPKAPVKTPKKKKRKPMDSAGWGFFIITFLVLIGPGIYIAWVRQSSFATEGAPVLIGLLGTFIVAGFVTWFANMILQALATRRRKAAKEKGA